MININACLYDNEGIIRGSITDSVLKKFQEEWDNLYLKYRESKYFNILAIMNKTLRKSQENITADFLNCLKLIVRKHSDKFDIDFLQDVSRAYHNLVRYCCSTIVYQEVFDDTIDFLRNNGIDYKGKDVQGVEDEYCAFDCNGLTVGIKIREKSDLYALYDNNEIYDICAIVYAGDRKYIIIENSLCRLVDAIKACIEDYKFDSIELSFDDFAQQLMEIAKQIYYKG